MNKEFQYKDTLRAIIKYKVNGRVMYGKFRKIDYTKRGVRRFEEFAKKKGELFYIAYYSSRTGDLKKLKLKKDL